MKRFNDFESDRYHTAMAAALISILLASTFLLVASLALRLDIGARKERGDAIGTAGSLLALQAMTQRYREGFALTGDAELSAGACREPCHHHLPLLATSR